MGINPQMLRQLQKQAQQLQEKMAKETEKLDSEVYQVSAGGGAVSITIKGDYNIQELKIDKDAVDPDDVELLEDMLKGAVNEAIKKVQADRETRMGALTKGMIPPGMGI